MLLKWGWKIEIAWWGPMVEAKMKRVSSRTAYIHRTKRQREPAIIYDSTLFYSLHHATLLLYFSLDRRQPQINSTDASAVFTMVNKTSNNPVCSYVDVELHSFSPLYSSSVYKENVMVGAHVCVEETRELKWMRDKVKQREDRDKRKIDDRLNHEMISVRGKGGERTEPSNEYYTRESKSLCFMYHHRPETQGDNNFIRLWTILTWWYIDPLLHGF